MLVLGDAHADDPSNRRALLAAYDDIPEEVAIQVGDLIHYDLPVPTWFIAGNNEDFDVIDSLRAGEDPEGTTNANLLASTAVDLDGIRIGGLSGNFAPTRFEKDRSELEDDRRRHFVRAEVERAKALTDVDVFLSHEGPRGIIHRGYDVGNEHNDAILRELTPDLCLVGHHHEHVEDTFGETRVISLAPVWESYYTLDPDSLVLDRHPTPEA